MLRQAYANEHNLLQAMGCLLAVLAAGIGLIMLSQTGTVGPGSPLALIAGVSMVVLARHGATRAATVVFCTGLLIVTATASLFRFGFYAQVWVFVPIAVMLSIWLLGGKATLAFATVTTALTACVYVLHQQGRVFIHDIPPLGTLTILVGVTWLSAFVGQALVIHLRRQMQIAHAAQAQLAAIFEGSPDLIWSVHPEDFRLQSFNPSFADFMRHHHGLQASAGLPPNVYFPDVQKRQAWLDMFRRTLAEGAHTVEYSFAGDRTLLLSFNLVRDQGQVNGISVIGKEITLRKQAEQEALRKSEALEFAQAELERAQALARIGNWELDPATGQAKWSTENYRIFGLEPGTPVTHELFISRVHPDDLACIEAGWQAAVRHAPSYEHFFRISVDGQVKWLHNRLEFEYDAQGQLRKLFGTTQDISELRLAQQQVQEVDARMRLATETLHFGFFEDDLLVGKSFWSDQAKALAGLSAGAALPRSGQVPDFVHPEDVDRFRRALDRALDPDGDGMLDCTHRILRPDGSLSWILVSGRAQFAGKGLQREAVRLQGIMLDVTEQHQASERVEFLALHDALTGLPNRVHGQDRLQQAVALAARQQGSLAVLNLDLDKFKIVNDTHGHAVGDQLLEAVARRLLASLRKEDMLCRLSGDEFMIVLPDLQGPNHASNTCERILNQLGRPFDLNGLQLSTSFSIGVALYPQDGGDSQTLLRNADMALYEAKRAGRNAWRFFEPQMNASLRRYLEIRQGLTLALERGEFELHYQPQFSLQDSRLIGFEALLRWNRPDHGLTMPADFIPAAEDSGLIVPIGRWVLQEACRQAACWQAGGWQELIVSVNLSSVQLREGLIEHDVDAALAASGIPPTMLELELTESVLLQHDNEVMASLQRLGQRGVRLAIDDFGTGYSNLSYLKRFNLDKLKIDRSFVRDLGDAGEDRIIVQAMLQMARNLQIKTIAEGVESAETAEHLQGMGCDEVQGFFYGRPMPASVLDHWLAEVAQATT